MSADNSLTIQEVMFELESSEQGKELHQSHMSKQLDQGTHAVMMALSDS